MVGGKVEGKGKVVLRVRIAVEVRAGARVR